MLAGLGDIFCMVRVVVLGVVRLWLLNGSELSWRRSKAFQREKRLATRHLHTSRATRTKFPNILSEPLPTFKEQPNKGQLLIFRDMGGRMTWDTRGNARSQLEKEKNGIAY